MSVNNLPSQPTSFVGREKELLEIANLLSDSNCRLLTLVGAGGIGKTRLALQAGVDQEPHFVDGVPFIPLTPIASSDLLMTAIEAALEIPRTQITHYLREKQMLLVMDNFEHLLRGVGLLTELLQAAPRLKILATSRERLNLQEEWVLALDGLSYPQESSTGSMGNYSAVQLFVQRAHQVQPHFSAEQNEQAVYAICRHVEGITNSLDFLTTPLRNIPERHRSLRMVFEQSWNLLSGDEQAVLMRLSIFHGGFDLEAAVQVADASPLLLAGLVDKSLVRLTSTGRYDLHELLRQYAADKLAEAGATDNTAHRHLDYFVKLTERGEAFLFGGEQIPWFDKLEIEFNNLRAALAWSLRDEEHEAGLRLISALCWFFTERDHPNEGFEWLERLLALNPNVPPSLRAKALYSAAALTGYMQEEKPTRLYGEQALALSRQLNDPWHIAWSLSHLGFNIASDRERGITMLEESIVLFRELDDPFGLSHALVRRSIFAFVQKDYAYAHELLPQALAIASKAGDKIIMGWVYNMLGTITWHQDNLRQAKLYYQNGLSIFREAHFDAGINITIRELAAAEDADGNYALAEALYKEALTLLRNSINGIEIVLVGLASVASSNEQYTRTATLLGAVDPGFTTWIVNWHPKVVTYDRDIAAARTQLGETAFDEAWAAGKAMTRTEAIAYALADETSSVETPLPIPTADQPLTDRELEILNLVADGLNSREIAQQLVLSVGTIRWYLKLIYSKLDAHSRSEAIARARTLHILT
jgi:predicted ATPase/DNA-binding CsgD family transcriptional regulator